MYWLLWPSTPYRVLAAGTLDSLPCTGCWDHSGRLVPYSLGLVGVVSRALGTVLGAIWGRPRVIWRVKLGSLLGSGGSVEGRFGHLDDLTQEFNVKI